MKPSQAPGTPLKAPGSPFEFTVDPTQSGTYAMCNPGSKTCYNHPSGTHTCTVVQRTAGPSIQRVLICQQALRSLSHDLTGLPHMQSQSLPQALWMKNPI